MKPEQEMEFKVKAMNESRGKSKIRKTLERGYLKQIAGFEQRIKALEDKIKQLETK